MSMYMCVYIYIYIEREREIIIIILYCTVLYRIMSLHNRLPAGPGPLPRDGRDRRQHLQARVIAIVVVVVRYIGRNNITVTRDIY